MTHTNTVLIADDDPSLRQVITAILQEENFKVIQAVDGAECLRVAYARQPDVILLDIMMPQMDGRQVCKKLRELSSVPIIMLTALSMSREKVERLLEGADDYITKPFNNEELVARIRAILRRSQANDDAHRQVYDDGHLFIDFLAHQIRIMGAKIALSPTEWRLLEYLCRHPHRVILREELVHHVWGEGFESEYSHLKVFISKLRQKISDPARRPRYIHTERDAGYRFEPHN